MRKEFAKPAKNYEGLILSLQSKNLIVEDTEYAKAVLKKLNYYRLRGYYIHLYDKINDKFHNDIFLSQIVNVHDFDRKLAGLTLQMIIQIEISMRAKIAYFHSNAYGGLGYLLSENFINKEYHNKLLEKISKAIAQSKDNFKKHFETKHSGEFPLWAVVELITISELSMFVKNMKPHDLDAIAFDYFNFMNRSILTTNFHLLTVIRNTCAHGGRIYNRTFTMFPLLKNEHSTCLPSQYRNRYFGVLFAIMYLSPDSITFDKFISDFDSLLIKYQDSINLIQLGLPEDWKVKLLSFQI